MKKEKSFPGFLEYLKDYCLVDTSNRRKISKNNNFICKNNAPKPLFREI